MKIGPKAGYDTEEKNAYRDDVLSNLFIRRTSLQNKKFLCLPSFEGLEIPIVIERGIKEENIIAVDHHKAILNAPWRRRFPKVRVLIAKIEDAIQELAQEGTTIHYANLDLCGTRSQKTSKTLSTMRGSKAWAADARIAVTVIKGRDDLNLLAEWKAELKRSKDNRVYYAFNCLSGGKHLVIKQGAYKLPKTPIVEYGVMELKTKPDLKIHLDSNPVVKPGRSLGKSYLPSNAELTHLLNVTSKTKLHAKRNTAILMFSYFVGCNASEIVLLRVNDVIDEAGKIRDMVDIATNKQGRKPKDKSDNSKRRIIYLTNADVRRTLQEYLDERREAQGICFNVQAKLFWTCKGGGLDRNTAQQLISKLHRAANLKGGTSHSGRQWYASRLISNNVKIEVAAEMMGISIASMSAYARQIQKQPLIPNLREIAASITCN